MKPNNRHCATHQVRLILISSIVISCLLFPAVALYSSAQTTTFSLSFHVSDALLTPDDISNYFALEDVRDIWDGHDTLRTREDSMARARCGKEGIVRVERIILHDGFQPEAKSDGDRLGSASLTRKLLQATLSFETRLSKILAERHAPCVRSPAGRCLVLSPLEFWDHDEDALLSDPNPHESLGSGRNASLHGLTVTSDMVLAGGSDGEFDGNMAFYPVLTYFFPEADCLANGGHYFWLNAVEKASSDSGAEVIVVSKAPRLIALQHQNETKAASRFTPLQVLTYSAYLVFFIYFTRQMRRMDKVHSRVGLALTGIVEIVVSTVTSLSVCALVGFRITMVPWEIFPIVVIFIGVENMFSIVDAVIKTSIALPVKERIAEGLGRAGTSNTLKLCTYNAVLGVIAFFSTGAIRQFCAFAIVVLVAHWFLVHTFFVTVLSIDIQRLELDELLRQGSSLMPTNLSEHRKPSELQPQTKLGRFATAVQRVLRGRPAKNISLVLLLAVTATLYFVTQPHGSARKMDSELSLNRSRLARVGKPVNTETISPALQVWQILNPESFNLVHLRIESPTILVLNPNQGQDHGEDHRFDRQPMLEYEKAYRSRWARLWHKASRPLTWAFNIVILPTLVTTTLLYGLLLYLLKDAELLEAQRNRRDVGTPEADGAIPAVEDPVSFTTLPRAFVTDVDLIAASADGNVVATIGLQNEFVLWRMDTKAYSAIDTGDILLGSSGSSHSPASTLTAIGVHEDGLFVAAGTGTGIIAIWSISQNRIQPLPHLNADTFSSVTNIRFVSRPPIISGRVTPRRRSSAGRLSDMDFTEPPGSLYATYDNGAVIKWDLCSPGTPTYIKPSRSASVIKSMLLPVQDDGRLIIGFILEDGSLELCDADKSNSLLAYDTSILAGNPADLVDRADICCVELEGERRVVVGAATQAGVVSLWEAGTGECMRILDEPFGPISNMRIIPVSRKRCSTCREPPPESFILCFSFGQVVLFYRAYLGLPTMRRCSCPISQTKVISSVLGRRSRGSSVASVNNSPGTTSPAIVRSRMSSFSSSTAYDSKTMFPVSIHGSHLRRASDKRSLDTYIPVEADEQEGRQPVGPQDMPNGALNLSTGGKSTSLWDNLVVTCTADATFERGSWDVANNKIIGIRRKPRIPKPGDGDNPKDINGRGSSPQPHGRKDTVSGLSLATLERWELWTFDPSESRLQASPLLALGEELNRPDKNNTKTNGVIRRHSSSRSGNTKVIPRLHFTRVSPLFSSRSFCLAGFGNTVGFFNFHGDIAPRTRPPTPPNDFSRK
ncbi:sterol-sensing domain of SREBP cleavage-activation-domain-containing protein [Irpex rosettiformis]|uniref:Sterol-sensing domain of SREBP cleavage-activation-domain-containing protein n=1 Tax=Irpex rosettiformis TaxID=378272 RepID=A0ACB8UHT7_9APHY|nr:sterol-sensing domain of SREBP cleavage-activation-domain-containing protein [Irpex rosettiformis]